MTFSNPIVGGTTLIRKAIKSPNYVAGVSGWTINVDGTAEFNNVTVRGDLLVTSTSGSSIHAFATNTTAEIDFQPPSGSLPYDPARIYTDLSGTSPELKIFGPETASPIFATGGSLTMRADTATKKPIVTLLGDQIILGANVALSTVEVKAPITVFDHDCVVDGVFTAANRIVSTAVLTNTTANVPFSLAVTFGTPLTGTNFVCQVTANTTVPGTSMLGVGYTGLSASGVTLWITRSNVQSTTVSFTVEGY
jgi:hypothetical protein